MDKAFKDWTLRELKEYCEGNAGGALCGEGRCPFGSICDCLTDSCDGNIVPGDWDLSEPPRWTQEDIEDAKAAKRLFPWMGTVKRSGDRIVLDSAEAIAWINAATFPSLKLGETVSLQEILDEEVTK